MRLTHLMIGQYKHLKHVVVDVEEISGQEEAPVYFCIGLNGSGKSTFLEAVALIFSRISQNELPGFDFELEYDIVCEGRNAHVKVLPEKDHRKGKLCIRVDEGTPFYSFAGMEKYLPYKVITYVSGPNSSMEQLVNRAAEESLISDLFDASQKGEAEQMDDLLKSMETARSNPRVLYLGETMANLVLFILCAWKPGEGADYEKKRAAVFQKLSGGFMPRVLSVSAGASQRGSLFRSFFQARSEDGKSGLADWVSRDEEGVTAAMVVEGAGTGYCVERICEEYPNPFQLLTVLLRALDAGDLRGCHVQFQTREGRAFLGEQALSDGELLWIARMGLILLAGQGGINNCLFLFDEPDVHLNESWNVEFISQIRLLSRREQGGASSNSFWISTHSSLLLTDALPGHVYLFERKQEGISARLVPISLFGAGRPEISERVFTNRAQIGEFAKERIEGVIEDREMEPEELLTFINMTGAGIQRFRLLDKYYEMIQR